MIIVYAGWAGSHNPTPRGIHAVIGTAADLAEARSGFEAWCRQEREEWLAVLIPANPYPRSYSEDIVAKARFWGQFVEFTPGAETEFTLVEEVESA